MGKLILEKILLDVRTQKRLNKIKNILGNDSKTVRNILYKLYPNLHGKSLDRKYNTTIKDTVRLRTSGQIKYHQIKEVRTSVRNSKGYQSIDDFVKKMTKTNLGSYYFLNRRPSHIKPIECWFEKETIIDEFEYVCSKYDIPTLPVRGKPQWSTLYNASERLTNDHVILYFGDNDKTGKQIFGTIVDYLHFLKCECTFRWCAITDAQEKKYGLPHNARLDGLDDKELHEVIKTEILKYINSDKLKNIELQEKKDKLTLNDYVLKLVKKENMDV